MRRRGAPVDHSWQPIYLGILPTAKKKLHSMRFNVHIVFNAVLFVYHVLVLLSVCTRSSLTTPLVSAFEHSPPTAALADGSLASTSHLALCACARDLL